MQAVGNLLELSEIGRDRMCLRWVSAAEGQLFADYVKEYSDVIQDMGPFNPVEFKMPLTAVATALSTRRIRWMLGMETKLTKEGNVYNETLKEDDYQKAMLTVIEEEYHDGLILEALSDGPRAVKDIAMQTGLQVYKVSQRLVNLEQHSQAAFVDYKGSTPQFIRTER